MSNQADRMVAETTKLAFQGQWDDLLPLLRDQTTLVNSTTSSKGYMPLHQAAWHGAAPSIVGELLALGADRSLQTIDRGQTARDIAFTKHGGRDDLNFLLAEGGRTVSQLARKLVAESPDLFHDYDGNRIILDYLINSFGFESFQDGVVDVPVRVADAFRGLTGADIFSSHDLEFGVGEAFRFDGDQSLWRERILPSLSSLASRACMIPVERPWASVADLFDPAPEKWGLRGDLFLWLEMQRALRHVPLPDDTETLRLTLSSAFTALTGHALDRDDFRVERFARGGMSSGGICGGAWIDALIPLLEQRLRWLQESWVLN